MTSPSHPSTGRVILVGAGPGDPRLLTLAAVDALAAADVVFVDRLVNPVVLSRRKLFRSGRLLTIQETTALPSTTSTSG